MTFKNSFIKFRSLEPTKQKAYFLGLVMVGLMFIPNSGIAAESGLLENTTDSTMVETITENSLIHTLAKNEKNNKESTEKNSSEETQSTTNTLTLPSEENGSPLEDPIINKENDSDKNEILPEPTPTPITPPLLETKQTTEPAQNQEVQPPPAPPVTQTEVQQPSKAAPAPKPKSPLVQQASAEETEKLAFSFPVEQLNSPVVKDVISQVSVPLLSLWAPVPLNSPYVSENLNPETTTNLYTLASVLALTGILLFRKKPKEIREELPDSVIFRLKQIN